MQERRISALDNNLRAMLQVSNNGDLVREEVVRWCRAADQREVSHLLAV